jgi:hypothetical protein
MNARPSTCYGLLRAMLRQPHLTSDALLLTAEALDALPDMPASAEVARLMRVIAPCYAGVPLEAGAQAAEAAPPAQALLAEFPASAAELLALQHFAATRLGQDGAAHRLATALYAAARARLRAEGAAA